MQQRRSDSSINSLNSWWPACIFASGLQGEGFRAGYSNPRPVTPNPKAPWLRLRLRQASVASDVSSMGKPIWHWPDEDTPKHDSNKDWLRKCPKYNCVPAMPLLEILLSQNSEVPKFRVPRWGELKKTSCQRTFITATPDITECLKSETKPSLFEASSSAALAQVHKHIFGPRLNQHPGPTKTHVSYSQRG